MYFAFTSLLLRFAMLSTAVTFREAEAPPFFALALRSFFLRRAIRNP